MRFKYNCAPRESVLLSFFSFFFVLFIYESLAEQTPVFTRVECIPTYRDDV